jgi:hypothetical protein
MKLSNRILKTDFSDGEHFILEVLFEGKKYSLVDKFTSDDSYILDENDKQVSVEVYESLSDLFINLQIKFDEMTRRERMVWEYENLVADFIQLVKEKTGKAYDFKVEDQEGWIFYFDSEIWDDGEELYAVRDEWLAANDFNENEFCWLVQNYLPQFILE